MVMATASAWRGGALGLSPQLEVMSGGEGVEGGAGEGGGAGGLAGGDEGARALHDQLVAYVHALSGDHETRSGVWMEHSYARARDVSAATHTRVLLAPPPPPPPDADADLDVESASPPPPELPLDHVPPDADLDMEEADAHPDDDDWEARVAALAPTATHARLAAVALECLRRVRLARLARGAGRGGRAERAEDARAAARRLRAALAPLWAWGGAPQQRPAAWLHAALAACLPRSYRAIYDEVLGELRRAAPRLFERLLAGRAPAAAEEPLAAVGAAVRGEEGAVVAWVSAAGAGGGADLARRLGALVEVRGVRGASAPAAPDAWCGAAAGAARHALNDLLADVGERPVIVGGAGAGAALAALLVSGLGAGKESAGAGGGVRGLMLVSPPLLTAEGARDTPDDALHEIRVPMLIVCGTRDAACWRGACGEVAGGGGGGARRVVVVCGADEALRVPRRRRAPHHAVLAAVAEEMARWTLETAEAAAEAREGRHLDPEYAHLPALPALPPQPIVASPASGGGRAIEIVEGRVVSRVSGSTPLALVPPRRGAGATAAGDDAGEALAAADIMHMPIVFADDDRTVAPQEPAAEGALTVTSGDARRALLRGEAEAGAGGAPHPPAGFKYTRVIVAKRGGARVVAARAHASPAAPVRVGAGQGARAAAGGGGARSVVVRRGVRVVSRQPDR